MKFIEFNNFKGQTPKVADRRRMQRQSTVFIELPDIDLIGEAAAHYVLGYDRIISVRVGVAITHPNDNFCKRIGRLTAIDNSKIYEFSINKVRREDNGNTLIKLENPFGILNIEINVQNEYCRAKFFNLFTLGV